MSPTPDALRRTGGRRINRVVFDEATIASRVVELGAEITAAYPDGDLLVLGLLKGSFIFLGDLVRQIERPLQVDVLVVSSYGPETVLGGKHILLVEDIIDTGRTLGHLADILRGRQPRSLGICALLDKQLAPARPAEVRFVGFVAPPAFLVGYGLDHAEDFRHLPFIADLA